ncbi:dienelactone hydrolase family protein [Microvirga sp. ACRRW]|uniref:alpha/beta hydrolase family protein n=1 Tax=Microvirga sp. ACRRW TaxID=2918205 RepID=UPI001EF4A424|nr:alpha/beta fold hydrolase [Microvirga sp. ACRRW]MCG7393363.1 dienelactone hydrolase family protein [Microvirga sp. ACRRW]
MKPALSLFALAFFGAVPNAEATETVGFRTLSVLAPERGSDLSVSVWYPAGEGGQITLVGDNLLFRGVAAMRNASPTEGRLPLVLLSHGSGGNAPNLSWLASHLAGQGFVVAAPNHPGSTSGDAAQASTIRIWNRPADMSAVLTAIMTDATFGVRIDPDRIGVVGFSLGGHTALALAGARADAETYASYCEGNAAGPECAWFVRGGVNFRALDKERFNRSNLDERIKSVIAVDPAMAQAYRPESLAAIAVPTHIINLGRPGWIIPAVEGSKLARSIPGGGYDAVPDASHFSFLGECKPEGPELLKAEGDEDPLCEDGGARPRAAIHAQLADRIAAIFSRDLKKRP